MVDNAPINSPAADQSKAAEPATRDLEKEIRERAYAIWENEGRPEGRAVEHWERAERQISGEFHLDKIEMEGDDVPKLDALREAARKHTDAFLVKSDLEDADERTAAPGTREQP
ncbi:DUF2934 domain-containing protein (plasmid) [Rhizobium sp. CB3171]|uniref:DUF2934 domain-containing protein n=1 Tax=Rhizobium sp. CB3171 TaxID=3039157 RepID=UPI0024B20118|nr:DUF2934 domain-containing protein [Rhizobium sp. CB3171]WFU06114.1 DUF2934 domain-containing protein [Rhizobium sp. CB3171]